LNSIWNNNLKAFKNRFPQLADIFSNEISRCSDSENFIATYVPEWQLSQSKNNQYTVSENGLRLHSAYNPEGEASGAVSAGEVQSKSTTVFYGFGIGYHLLEWAKLYSCKTQDSSKYPEKLVVIEPDVNRFLASMCLLDWCEIFKIEQLILAIGCPAESVLQLLENSKQVNIGATGVSDAFFFDIPAFTSHAQNYFDTIKTLVKRNQRKNEINAATLKKFGKLWCNNSLKNLKKMAELRGIRDYEKKADSDLPFLIVGAGPSLEKTLPYIKELKNRCVIVCVETALRALLRFDVEPDFIILTDPQYWAYRHIAGLKSLSSILITEISTYASVFRFPCKEIILCSSQFPVGKYFEEKLQVSYGDLGTGGSVASSAWNFAYFCGAKKIFVTGLDFAFPKKQTHIKGSSAEQTFHTISNKLGASDKFTAGALYSANAVLSKDYKGNPVLTDSRMKMFSWWFEARLAACSDVETFTLSPEGLNTPGIKPAEIEDILINNPDISEKKKCFLESEKNTNGKQDNLSVSLNKMILEFPQKDFLEKFPFLESYL